jgi:hypothetical protein
MQNDRNATGNERQPNQAIDFGDALRQWHDYVEQFARAPMGEQDRAMTKLHADYEARSAATTKAEHKPGTCELCGWPRGEHGFIRYSWPVGHALFGRAVKCPRCNP